MPRCRRTLVRQKGKTVVKTHYREREFAKREEKKSVAKHWDGKAAGTDNIVNELMNYAGEGMPTMMVMMYSWVWENEYASEKWREGVLVKLFKKKDKADRGNYLEMTLVRTVCQKICDILNDNTGTMLEKDENNEQRARKI